MSVRRGQDGLGVCLKYLEPGARLLRGWQESIRSLGWDTGVGDGPALGSAWGLESGERNPEDNCGPTAAPRGQEGLASHRWSVCPAGKGGAGSGCPASEEPLVTRLS